MNKTSQYAYLRIDGNDDFPLDVVTERLGVQPTKTKKVGKRLIPDHSINKRVHKITSWYYEIDTIEAGSSRQVLQALLEAFQSKIDNLKQLKDEFNLEVVLELVIQIYNGESPGLVIDPDFSKFASEINAVLDVDMYVYPFHELEE